MKKNKYISEIAARLPVCHEERVTGFVIDDGKPRPNIEAIPVNHERRMRKAYQELGMQGIKNYLDWIHKKIDENKR